MAFPVTFYTISKKHNSTALPTGGTEYQCDLRHAVSILTPVIIAEGEDLSSYNYCYIPRYHRYYWVTDVSIQSRNMWVFSLSCDVLATYKTTIGNAEEYVARSSHSSDPWVQDSMYPSKAGTSQLVNEITTPFVSDASSGTYIIGAVNGQTEVSTPAVTYYRLTKANYAALLHKLQNQTQMADILGIVLDDPTSPGAVVTNLTGCLQNISYDVYLSQVNPIQYIVSSIYVPLAPADITSTGGAPLKLGKYTILSDTFNTLGMRATLATKTIAVPKHPQAASRGQYLLCNPYSVYTIRIPGFGLQELNASRVSQYTNIHFKIVIDTPTGAGYCYLWGDDDEEGSLGILTGAVGVNVPVTQLIATDLNANLVANVSQVASNVLSKGGEMLTSLSNIGNAIGMNVAQSYTQAGSVDWSTVSTEASNIATGITDGIQPIPTLAMSGSVGGSSALSGDAWVKLEYFTLCDEDNETLGRPLMKVKKLSTIPGFIKCIDTHVVTNGTTAETQAVNAYMQGGFFYE